MVEVREINVASIGEPAHVKISRGSGGRLDYEISYHAPTMRDALDVVKRAREEMERELYGCG